MNRNKLTKKILIGIFLFSLTLTVGLGSKPVELLVENLIDLGAAIDLSIMGATGTEESSDQNTTAEEQSESSEMEPEQPNNPEPTPPDPEPTERKLTVEIKGKEILCEGKVFSSVDDLIKHIKEAFTGAVSIRLKDNYAEAHIYHSVDDTLKEYCKENGYEYDAD